MSGNDPRPARPAHPPDKDPHARPTDTAANMPPREGTAQQGPVPPSDTRSPDAATTPSTAPHTVVGPEGMGRSYDPDEVARKEAEARDPARQPPQEREQGAVRQELLEEPNARRDAPLRFGLIILAVIVVAILFWMI